jgi:hypothetical protein
MFSSSTQSLTQQIPVFMPAVSQAPAVIIQARTASVSGGIIQADELHDKTAQGLALTPVVKEMRYRQQVTSSSPLSSSDCGVEGGQEVMLPTQILVNRIIRTLEQGEMILQSVNWDKEESPFNLSLMQMIDEQFLATPYYGSRQMTCQLRRSGYQVSRKRVRRLMRLMGLEAIYQTPRTSLPHPEHKIYPYLL